MVIFKWLRLRSNSKTVSIGIFDSLRPVIILAVLVIKRVQRDLPKLQAKRAIIRTLAVTYCTLQTDKRSSVLNLPKQRQVCPSLFFQFNNAHIRDLRHPKRVVSVLSPLASSSCGGSNLLTSSACSRGILQHALAIGFDHANILAMLQMQVFVCFHVVRLPVGCIKSSGAGVILRSHKFHNHLLYILPLPVLYLLTISNYFLFILYFKTWAVCIAEDKCVVKYARKNKTHKTSDVRIEWPR